MRARFWKHYRLDQLTQEEWEALCDGCGKCCLNKLQDDETDEIWYSSVHCQYLGSDCRCQVYDQRLAKVPGCLQMTPEAAAQYDWLPETCGYRRVALGQPLPNWHPLLTGDTTAMLRKGQNVWQLDPKPVCETTVPEDDWQDYIIGKG